MSQLLIGAGDWVCIPMPGTSGVRAHDVVALIGQLGDTSSDGITAVRVRQVVKRNGGVSKSLPADVAATYKVQVGPDNKIADGNDHEALLILSNIINSEMHMASALLNNNVLEHSQSTQAHVWALQQGRSLLNKRTKETDDDGA